MPNKNPTQKPSLLNIPEKVTKNLKPGSPAAVSRWNLVKEKLIDN